MTNSNRPLLLLIFDGWGYREDAQYNAIASANAKNFLNLWQHYPHMLIRASGLEVGLPVGQMGNSEVGHLNMGAGRIVYQDFPRINQAIEQGEFFQNPMLNQAVNKVLEKNSALHILGLLSPGGVHSHESHIHAMLQLAVQKGLKNIYLHVFLDGRDTPPQSAAPSLQALEEQCNYLRAGKVASIIGRYYAMDRDKRWERTQKAYELLTEGKTIYHSENALDGLQAAYARGETDEFIQATSIHASNQLPITISDNDAVIFMNFRTDRTRQLTHAFIDEPFTQFNRTCYPNLSSFVTLTNYDTKFAVPVAFPQLKLTHILGECLAEHGLQQLRIAETEKYAHVTFFLNGGIEVAYPGEERKLIPSPKIATYDLQPEMSAIPLTEQLIAAINSKKYDVIICNYANADMVGHTGSFNATVKAINVLDDCLGKVITALQQVGGEAIITADHGNAEFMFDTSTNQPHTAHTNEPIPFIYIGRQATINKSEGLLADIAPTMLYLLNLPIPQEMTGTPLVNLQKQE